MININEDLVQIYYESLCNKFGQTNKLEITYITERKTI